MMSPRSLTVAARVHLRNRLSDRIRRPGTRCKAIEINADVLLRQPTSDDLDEGDVVGGLHAADAGVVDDDGIGVVVIVRRVELAVVSVADVGARRQQQDVRPFQIEGALPKRPSAAAGVR